MEVFSDKIQHIDVHRQSGAYRATAKQAASHELYRGR